MYGNGELKFPPNNMTRNSDLYVLYSRTPKIQYDAHFCIRYSNQLQYELHKCVFSMCTVLSKRTHMLKIRAFKNYKRVSLAKSSQKDYIKAVKRQYG